MKTLLELLAVDTEGMTPAEMADHLAAIEAAAAVAAEGDITDEVLAALDQAAERVESLRASIDAQAEADAQREAQAQAALDRIAAAATAGDDEGEPDEADADEDADTAGEADEADATDADVAEVIAEAEAVTEDAASGAPVAVAAAATPAPRVSKVAARRPKAAQPRAAQAKVTDFALTASANVPGVTAGQPLRNMDQIAAAFDAAVRATKGYANGPRVKMSVAQGRAQYEDQFTLDGNPERNAARMRAIREGVREHGSLQALAAAGGACAPYEVRYDQPIIGTDARPVRDQMLTRMGADRGGVTLLPSPRLADVMDAVDFWDDDAGTVLGDEQTTTKPVLEVACDDPFDVDTYDVTRILRFSNYSARFFRERVESIINLTMVAQARKAERKLLTLLGAACTNVTLAQVLSTTRDVLAGLDQVLAAQRNRYRVTSSDSPMIFGHPAWLIDMMRADLARELPGSADERLALAEAKIAEFLAVRNVTPVAFLDGETGQEFAAQSAGAATAWPSTVVTYLYPAGEAFFLDGGSLDLGIVRDSTLNGTNKFEVFAETSEGFAYNGATDPLRLVFTTKPIGRTSGTVDLT